MEEARRIGKKVLLVGNDKLTFSIALCLLRAEQKVVLQTAHQEKALDYFAFHSEGSGPPTDAIRIVKELEFDAEITLAIAITPESLELKRAVIQELENNISEEAILVINSETISLGQLQQVARKPARIIGGNWVEPAFSTYFLEIIANEHSCTSLVDSFYEYGKLVLGKDPYTIHGENGVRMRLKAAMIREGLFLVKNGYASIEDIDRACRNDAGYYLPFAGNLRYMDLMGTYAYGMVMKDLNLELTKDSDIPEGFTSLIANNDFGIQSGKGFYDYSNGEAHKWEILMKQFNKEIVKLFEKYPFKYEKLESEVIK